MLKFKTLSLGLLALAMVCAIIWRENQSQLAQYVCWVALGLVIAPSLGLLAVPCLMDLWRAIRRRRQLVSNICFILSGTCFVLLTGMETPDMIRLGMENDFSDILLVFLVAMAFLGVGILFQPRNTNQSHFH